MAAPPSLSSSRWRSDRREAGGLAIATTPPVQLVQITELPGGIRTLGTDIRRFDLATELIAPNQEKWVTPDDAVMIFYQSSLAGVTIQVAYRLMTWDGDIIFGGGSVVTTADRLLFFRFFTLQYGFLLGVNVYAIGSPVPLRGQVLCQAEVVRNPAGAVITQYGCGMDYLTRTNNINWPFSREITGVEGPGAPLSVAGAAPAAGAEFSQTVPTNARWKLRGVSATLAASAVVATRTPTLTVDDGVNVLLGMDGTITATAGQVRNFKWLPGYPVVASSNIQLDTHMTADITLQAGWRVRSVTTGLDAGDQYSAVRFYVEEWLEG